jgi:hypothetical protein
MYTMTYSKTSKPKAVARFFAHLVLAVGLTYCLASAMHSQSTLNKLSAIGVEIPFNAKLQTLWLDFSGLLPAYGLTIFGAFLIGMLVAMFVSKKVSGNTIWIYSVGGAAAMAVMLLAMHPILNVTLISGARGLSGLLSQSLTGAFGGALFGWLAMRSRTV